MAGRFIENGFVRVEQAFPQEVAAQCRALLWDDVRRQVPGIDPDDAATWTEPVVRLGDHAEEPFARAANADRLVAAIDELVGRGRWVPRRSLGTTPVRFPSDESAGDDGWHVEGSFRGDADEFDYFRWRLNVASKDRALLMLFLFSEVGEDDAPTRVRVGSHRDVASMLAAYGEDGEEMLPFSLRAAEETADRPVELATGGPGDVYLCHPFLVHAAQRHRGTRPRFMAQPGLRPAVAFDVEGGTSPVERAIREAIAPERTQRE
ncbi:phytanoyl-CoA dioxygenase family protein [Nocardioides cheoyonin]|uniref:phytanoyl-CoA dioxygenase family protein n=1 Tax=Nocardioides cheoyonin TaxID=3156615 RepID=UPI0032B55F40